MEAVPGYVGTWGKTARCSNRGGVTENRSGCQQREGKAASHPPPQQSPTWPGSEGTHRLQQLTAAGAYQKTQQNNGTYVCTCPVKTCHTCAPALVYTQTKDHIIWTPKRAVLDLSRAQRVLACLHRSTIGISA